MTKEHINQMILILSCKLAYEGRKDQEKAMEERPSKLAAVLRATTGELRKEETILGVGGTHSAI